jgi:hypothetical protein
VSEKCVHIHATAYFSCKHMSRLAHQYIFITFHVFRPTHSLLKWKKGVLRKINAEMTVCYNSRELLQMNNIAANYYQIFIISRPSQLGGLLRFRPSTENSLHPKRWYWDFLFFHIHINEKNFFAQMCTYVSCFFVKL